MKWILLPENLVETLFSHSKKNSWSHHRKKTHFPYLHGLFFPFFQGLLFLFPQMRVLFFLVGSFITATRRATATAVMVVIGDRSSVSHDDLLRVAFSVIDLKVTNGDDVSTTVSRFSQWWRDSLNAISVWLSFWRPVSLQQFTRIGRSVRRRRRRWW